MHLVEITENMRECRNQKDNKVLALALNEESQYIVTGDKDLLVLHPFRSAIIITVEEFLKTIKFE
ncbi:putative toxin-antitoxin system toxin component, PIN family [Chroogloeocystis siderophila]|uniref:putative toxin-antitoxin system toxin component, PIN family n=1 Tax=Chroogloeocystis siderophila TaxID=329163 RepID=UPI0038B28306